MSTDLTGDIVIKRGIPRILTNMTYKALTKLDMQIVGYNEPAANGGQWLELNAFNMRELHTNGCEMGPDLLLLYRRLFGKRKTDELEVHLKHKLKPFQTEGVHFLHAKRGRAILADEMGLGKTIQVIGLLQACTELYTPTIIICPAHIKLNWCDEFAEFWHDDLVEVVFGMKTYRIPKGKRIIVINQHILKTWTPVLLELEPRLLVVDEAHTFVSKQTKTYDYVEKIARKAGRTILLTGSPLVNKADDLWGLCNLINPHIFGNYTRYVARFCPQKHNTTMTFARPRYTWGRSIKDRLRDNSHEDIGESDRRLLHRILVNTVMLRRTKEEVAPQMPKIIRKVIHVNVEGRQFWKAEAELLQKIRSEMKELEAKGKKIKNPIINMKSFSRMRQIVGEAKLETIYEWIDTFLSESYTDKLVVVGWHKDVLGKLHAKYADQSYLITGDVNTRMKHDLEKQFQGKGGKRILFGNVKSIGTGINLTAAHHMLMVELPYTGVDLSQVEARIHRLSQLASFVVYNYIVIKRSLEDKLLKYISEKQRLAAKIIDGRDATTIEDIADDGCNTNLMRKLLLD